MEIRMKAWNEKNQTPFHPPDLGKNEGRGERKYAHDLCLQGYDASQNAPGQNPDILVVDGPGREIKQLDRGTFRVSASKDVMLSLARNIIRPLIPVAEKVLDAHDVDLLTIGSVKTSSLRKIVHGIGLKMWSFFEDVFGHSHISHIVFVFEEGYVEFDLAKFCECFDLYSIDKFVAKVKMKPDVKILPPK